MATKVSGTTYNGAISSVKFTDWFTYAVSETSTQYTLTLTAGMHFVAPTNYIIDAKTVNITGTGQTSKSGTISRFTSSGSAVDKTGISSFTWSWTKGHSSASKTITAYQTGHSGTKASKAFTVPAKPSYAVSYNANSGTGQPSNDTKWYNETLTLSTSRPTKEGYTFKGWATSVANAGTNTTTTTYTGNAPATFYATWELNYSKPSITNISIERCDANGNDDDEGGYAKVNFDWSVFASSASRYYGGNTYPYADNTISSASVTVGTFTKSFTASDTLPIIVGDGSFSTDTQYDVSITITDTQNVISDHTTTVAGTLATSFFPMDFNADGTAMGIFRPAPDATEGVYLGKHLYSMLDDLMLPTCALAHAEMACATNMNYGSGGYHGIKDFTGSSKVNTYMNGNYFENDANGFKVLKSGIYRLMVNAHMNGAGTGNTYAVEFWDHTGQVRLSERRFAYASGTTYVDLCDETIQPIDANHIILPRFSRYLGSQNWRVQLASFTIQLVAI